MAKTMTEMHIIWLPALDTDMPIVYIAYSILFSRIIKNISDSTSVI